MAFCIILVALVLLLLHNFEFHALSVETIGNFILLKPFSATGLQLGDQLGRLVEVFVLFT